jgi:hypothetical protein
MVYLRVLFWDRFYSYYLYLSYTKCSHADDTNILITGKNILSLNKRIQNAQNQLENSFCENCLIISTDKSNVLFFGGSTSIPSTRPLFCISNKEVVCTVDVKF